MKPNLVDFSTSKLYVKYQIFRIRIWISWIFEWLRPQFGYQNVFWKNKDVNVVKYSWGNVTMNKIKRNSTKALKPSFSLNIFFLNFVCKRNDFTGVYHRLVRRTASFLVGSRPAYRSLSCPTGAMPPHFKAGSTSARLATLLGFEPAGGRRS